MAAATKVKNVPDTAEETCPCCESWRSHWENATHQKADECSRVGCKNSYVKEDLVGAHVCEPGKNKQQYIVHLCKKCNGIDQESPFYTNAILVPVEKQRTCTK